MHVPNHIIGNLTHSQPHKQCSEKSYSVLIRTIALLLYWRWYALVCVCVCVRFSMLKTSSFIRIRVGHASSLVSDCQCLCCCFMRVRTRCKTAENSPFSCSFHRHTWSFRSVSLEHFVKCVFILAPKQFRCVSCIGRVNPHEIIHPNANATANVHSIEINECIST